MLFDGNLMCLKPQMDDFQGKYNLMQRADSKDPDAGKIECRMKEGDRG